MHTEKTGLYDIEEAWSLAGVVSRSLIIWIVQSEERFPSLHTWTLHVSGRSPQIYSTLYFYYFSDVTLGSDLNFLIQFYAELPFDEVYEIIFKWPKTRGQKQHKGNY